MEISLESLAKAAPEDALSVGLRPRRATEDLKVPADVRDGWYIPSTEDWEQPEIVPFGEDGASTEESPTHFGGKDEGLSRRRAAEQLDGVDYLFHVVPADVFADVEVGGLPPTSPEGYWKESLGGPGDEPRLYFHEEFSPLPEEVMVRVPVGALLELGVFTDGDVFTRSRIPPESLEILRDGEWRSLIA